MRVQETNSQDMCNPERGSLSQNVHMQASPVTVRRAVELARTPVLVGLGSVEPKEARGDADVGSNVFLGSDVTKAVRFQQRLPFVGA